MGSKPVEPSDIQEIWNMISLYHGPRRFEAEAAATINGAISLLESGEQYHRACLAGEFPPIPYCGNDVVWGWFVGSPRAFLFGLERSKSWAVRRMRKVLREEALFNKV